MLTTYFLGGLINLDKCGFVVSNTVSEFSELPNNTEFLISLQTKLKAEPTVVKKALTTKGYPKCKVKPNGVIMWYSKKSAPCKKFRLPQFTDLKKSSSIVGFHKNLKDLLNHPLNKTIGKVRIETTKEIEFNDSAIDSKSRLYPSVSVKKMFKLKKIDTIEYKKETILDFKNKNYKNIFELVENIIPLKELSMVLKPLITSIDSLKIITPELSISINFKPGIKFSILPNYQVRANIEISPLIFDNLSELVDLTSL